MDPTNNYTRYQHSATLIDSSIYIIGGWNTHVFLPNNPDFGADMLEIRTYQTVDGTWGTIRAEGRADGQTITPRSQHSATLSQSCHHS
ncbi:hypothetical protein [Absidia glauca]|uniref:Uncharacterized protein n=1 Tax=Absidia glauca TaxID=4829 RepID=A0A168MNL4_ABSGL|nr:hypothetical protein [Absidia glauca]